MSAQRFKNRHGDEIALETEEIDRFKALLREHQGWLIAAPEYNSGITPLLKNAIDWG